MAPTYSILEVNTYKRYAKATGKTDSEAESQRQALKRLFFRKSLKSISTHKQRSKKKKKKIKWEELKIHSEVGGDLRHKVRDITVMKLVEGGGRA